MNINDVFLLFHANDLQVFKEIWSYFDNYLCKVQLKLMESIPHLFISMRTISRCLFKSFNPFVIISSQNLCPFFIHGNYIFRHSLTWWFSLWECQTWSWIFRSFSYILLLMIWRTMVWRKIKMSFTIGLALVPCQNSILKGHSKLPKRFTFSMSIPSSKVCSMLTLFVVDLNASKWFKYICLSLGYVCCLFKFINLYFIDDVFVM